MGKAGAVFGMRLYSIIYATVAATPFIAVAYDQKVSAFCETVGANALIESKNFPDANVKTVVDSTFKYSDGIRETLTEKRELLRKKAARNSALALLRLDARKIMTIGGFHE